MRFIVSLAVLCLAAAGMCASAAAQQPYPPPPPGYYPPPPAAYGPPPGPGYAELAPGCRWGQRKVWIEGVGYRWRTVQICQ